MHFKGIQKIEKEVEGNFPNITEFFNAFPGVKTTEIDGKIADAVCEGCERAIMKGEKCYQWHDDIYTCMNCGGSDHTHEPIRL